MDSVRIENISFTYPRHKYTASENVFSIKNISFSLKKSSFLSILGPNGSGKSTILKLINRILLIHSGCIKIFDKDTATITRRELSRKIAFVPQIHNIAFAYTVYETVLMGRSPYLKGLGFESDIDREIAIEAIEKLDVKNLASKPIGELSGGEMQRVFIARALAQQCPILILDEPNTHLDLLHQIEILNLIKKLINEKNISVISVFHDINLASIFSDEILILNNGKIHAYGTPKQVINQININQVFKTMVEVDTHPFLDAPRITVLPNTKQ